MRPRLDLDHTGARESQDGVGFGDIAGWYGRHMAELFGEGPEGLRIAHFLLLGSVG